MTDQLTNYSRCIPSAKPKHFRNIQLCISQHLFLSSELELYSQDLFSSYQFHLLWNSSTLKCTCIGYFVLSVFVLTVSHCVVRLGSIIKTEETELEMYNVAPSCKQGSIKPKNDSSVKWVFSLQECSLNIISYSFAQSYKFLHFIVIRGGIDGFMGLIGIIGPGPIGAIGGPPIGPIGRMPTMTRYHQIVLELHALGETSAAVVS